MSFKILERKDICTPNQIGSRGQRSSTVKSTLMKSEEMLRIQSCTSKRLALMGYVE